MNYTTRKFPRTMTEAFGPYTSDRIDDTPQPWTWRGLSAAVVVVFAAVMLATACTPANAQQMTGRLLASHITGDDAKKIQAGYYIAGAFDAYKGVVHCAPDSIGPEQYLPLASRFVLANPQAHHLAADHILGFIFEQAWPCPKRSGRDV